VTDSSTVEGRARLRLARDTPSSALLERRTQFVSVIWTNGVWPRRDTLALATNAGGYVLAERATTTWLHAGRTLLHHSCGPSTPMKSSSGAPIRPGHGYGHGAIPILRTAILARRGQPHRFTSATRPDTVRWGD
jgi:hypothetical protein